MRAPKPHGRHGGAAESLAFRLPPELKQFQRFESTEDYLTHRCEIAEYIGVHPEFPLVDQVMDAAGLTAAFWYRIALERKCPPPYVAVE